jgi:hypothetical protein
VDDVTAVRELLHSATREMLPPPNLLEDARQGGRRRRTRRRFGVAAVGVALVASVLAGAQVLRPPAPVRYAGPLFDGRVHGDLAGDTAYLRQVLDVWKTSHATSANASRGIFDDLRGDAKVVWAGMTPAGKAAVVAQDAYVHRHGDIQIDHEGVYQLLGMFGPGLDGQPRLVGDTYPTPANEGSGSQTAWYVDSARTVVAVIDNGQEHGISYHWNYSADGRAQREFTTVPDHDEVGWTKVPAGTTTAATVVRLPYRTFDDFVLVQGSRPRDTHFTGELPWRRRVKLGTATDSSPVDLFKALQARRRGPELQVSLGAWRVNATTASGEPVLAAEVKLDDDPSRIYILVGGPDGVVLDLGTPDPSAALPVMAKLPQQQGWLVANLGASLDYRTSNGPWRPAGADAALLPADAAHVRVTANGQATEVALR